MIVVGIAAALFSILVFGGIVGIIDGGLSIAGGSKARPPLARARAPWRTASHP